MKAYGAIADLYESLMTTCDYGNWSQYVYNKLKNTIKGEKGVDLACGSGVFTRALKKRGLDVSGADISPEMLNAARINAKKENLNIEFIQKDMTELKLPSRVDFLTIINDGINYVPQNKLKTAFSHFRNNLKSGGVLFFDVSTEYKLKNIIGNNLFGEDDEDFSYLWFNTLFEDRVKMEISLFVREGEKYIKREETHEQFIHGESELKLALSNNGFEIVSIEGHLGEPLSEKSERMNILAIKR